MARNALSRKDNAAFFLLTIFVIIGTLPIWGVIVLALLVPVLVIAVFFAVLGKLFR